MCNTRFYSQGMILNGLWKNDFSKYVDGTRGPPNAILNFHFFSLSLMTMTRFQMVLKSLSWSVRKKLYDSFDSCYMLQR